MPHSTTARLYNAAQKAFLACCETERIVYPPHETDIARYLRACWAARGSSPVPVHLAAIADMYRSEGQPVDTRYGEIARVMREVRSALKTRSNWPQVTHSQRKTQTNSVSSAFCRSKQA